MSQLEPQPATSFTESFVPFKPPTPAQPRFDVTVERAPVGIAHFDGTGRFLYVNPQLCAMLGYSRATLLETPFQDITFADDLPRCLELTEQLAAGKIARYSVEERLARADGSLLYARVFASIVRGGEGAAEPPYFIGIIEDLTEHWQLERARAEAEERLKLALDVSATGIYRFDFVTETSDWSFGAARVLGLPDTLEHISLEQGRSRTHPDDLARTMAAYRLSATRGDDFNEEYRIVLADGATRWISSRARVTLDESGKPRYLTGAIIDITKLREAEAARDALFERERAARADAERAMKLRDDILAVVAHDLRNPLYAILMGAKAAVELSLSPEDQARQLAQIQHSARAMDALIRDLLDATQIDIGRLAITPGPTSVETLVDESVLSAAASAMSRGLRLETDVPPDLPPVIADHGRIVQVLGNLLGNAIKFTPRPGRIVVRARQAEAFVELAVTDTGDGIEPEHLPRVFDRYWQADRSARLGVGLGLAIARGIVEAHGGRIDVESTVGHGTTFRFTLPTVV